MLYALYSVVEKQNPLHVGLNTFHDSVCWINDTLDLLSLVSVQLMPWHRPNQRSMRHYSVGSLIVCFSFGGRERMKMFYSYKVERPIVYVCLFLLWWPSFCTCSFPQTVLARAPFRRAGFKNMRKSSTRFTVKSPVTSTNTCILIINIQSLVHNESYPKHILTWHINM